MLVHWRTLRLYLYRRKKIQCIFNKVYKKDADALTHLLTVDGRKTDFNYLNFHVEDAWNSPNSKYSSIAKPPQRHILYFSGRHFSTKIKKRKVELFIYLFFKCQQSISDISGSSKKPSVCNMTDWLPFKSLQTVTLCPSQSVCRCRIMNWNCLQLTSCHCVPAISGCGRGWLMRTGLFGRLLRQILGSTLDLFLFLFFFFKKNNTKKKLHWASRFIESAAPVCWKPLA